VYLENHLVVGLAPDDSLNVSYEKKIGNRPTGKENPELLRYKADPQHSNSIINGISRIGFMAGGQSAEWVDEDFPNKFVERSKKFINAVDQSPFFLFFSFHDIHVPRLPMKQFKGKTDMGVRGDAILQMDWTVGQIMKILRDKGLEENTLVIFTSDNGPVINDGYSDESVRKLGDHDPNGGFSGGKYSALEAGTRVPTIISWPGKVHPSESEALFSQVDIFSSLAAMFGIALKADEAMDGQDLSGLISGKNRTGRETMIEESETLALRKGNWKYIRPFNKEKYPSWIEKTKNIDDGLSDAPQLYNLENDPFERLNIAESNMDRVQEMESLIVAIEKQKTRKL